MIKVRGFRWPHRPTSVAVACLLSEDEWGHWLGIARGNPWWAADGSHSGVFDMPFVKVIPNGTFWTACFHAVDPVVDVDIVLPVHWRDDEVEEVDLELDVLRSADGSVHVRDQDAFAYVRQVWAMPADISTQAEATCAQVRALVERGAEPFGAVGRAWLTRFLADVDGQALRS